MTNYGTTTRGFVEFDLSSMPTENVVIDDATVYLWHHYNSNSANLELRQVIFALQILFRLLGDCTIGPLV